MITPAAPRPASTVVVLRPSGGAPEVYLVKRHGRSGFMAGAHVFPGGRVDEADKQWATRLPTAASAHALSMLDGEDDVTACVGFAVAAIRETAEECGLLLARSETGAEPGRQTAETVFEALKQGESFHALLDQHALVPDLTCLSTWAWWVTPEAEPRRYDTRFFLAAAPSAQVASIDDHEVTEGEWMTPAVALARYQAGEIQLAPPTLATLEDLLGAADLDAARAAAVRPSPRIMPVLHQDEGLVLSLPGDPLHPEPDPVWPKVRSRFVLAGGQRFSSAWVDPPPQ